MAGQRGTQIPSFSALQDFVNPVAEFQKYATGMGNQLRADEKEAAMAKERAADREYQKGRDIVADARSAQLISMQQAEAARNAEKFGIDKASIEGTQLASRDLQNATQGLVTPEQTEAITRKYQSSISGVTKEGAPIYKKDVDVAKLNAELTGMATQAEAKYNSSPVLQRQYISGVNVAQGPMQVEVGIDEVGKPKMVEVTGDVAKAQELKDRMLQSLDTKIQQDKSFEENQRQFGLKQKLDVAQLGVSIDKLKLEKQIAGKKDNWYDKAKMLGILNQELEKTNPIKIAERSKEKTKEAIAAADKEADRFAKYKSTVGTSTDAYDYAQWKAAGMPMASDPNYFKWGTW